MRRKPVIRWRTDACPHCEKARQSIKFRQTMLKHYGNVFPDWEEHYQLLLIDEGWRICRFHKLLRFIFQRWEEAPRRFEFRGVQIDGYYPGSRAAIVITSYSRSKIMCDLTISLPSATETSKDRHDGYVLFRFRKPYCCEFLIPVLDFVKYAPSDWVILLGELHSAIAEAEETKEEVTEDAGNARSS